MKLSVLGNQGPYPGPGGACSGYLIEQDGFRLLMDCGPGVLARLQEHCPLPELNAVILTHLHSDHIADMLVLVYALQQLAKRGLRRNTPLPVYMPDGPENERNMLQRDCFETIAIQDGRTYSIGGMEAAFLPVRHPVPCYAVSLRTGGLRLVFSADTVKDTRVSEFARGANVFLCDAGVLECDREEKTPHPSARQAGEMAAEAGTGLLLVTHLWPGYDPGRVLKEAQCVYPHTELAIPGRTYEL